MGGLLLPAAPPCRSRLVTPCRAKVEAPDSGKQSAICATCICTASGRQLLHVETHRQPPASESGLANPAPASKHVLKGRHSVIGAFAILICARIVVSRNFRRVNEHFVVFRCAGSLLLDLPLVGRAAQ